ncbi:leader peptidase (prepilin peptidase) / N-methyltransferase [Blastococcus aggregatus]|uniref:Leader peptidase (Prepilin peptidase) / N-methyltransferase n=1 Tax=Blastococcus aggregatus TaxID=38502 RepID=A0A285VCS0_9ACTN|nr:A24 family peptidase [Blastococcus aggregatus]SOC50866.1 leader peptidase (prepilin peptidase) / N-methyltransferase [Blastococcus aggregatus]
MSVLPAVVLGVVGIAVGTAVNRAAARYPWPSPPSVAGMLGPGPRAVRPPVVEIVAAVLFAAVGLRFGWSPDLPAWAWFVAIGLLLAVIDLREKLLPNRVLLPATVVAAGLLALAADLDDAWPDLLRALLAGAASFAVLLVMALLAPTRLGMGDVKLAALLGLVLGWFGWSAVLLGFLLGFLLQAVVGLALMAVRRAGRDTELPFGPALLTGTLVAVLLTGDWAAL